MESVKNCENAVNHWIFAAWHLWKNAFATHRTSCQFKLNNFFALFLHKITLALFPNLFPPLLKVIHRPPCEDVDKFFFLLHRNLGFYPKPCQRALPFGILPKALPLETAKKLFEKSFLDFQKLLTAAKILLPQHFLFSLNPHGKRQLAASKVFGVPRTFLQKGSWWVS